MSSTARGWLIAAGAASLVPLTVVAQEDFFDIGGAEDEAAAPVFENYLNIGVGYLSDDSFAYGKYSGLISDGPELLLDFRLQSMPAWDGDDTQYWRIEGDRIGQDNRRFTVEVGQQGTQRLNLGYRGMPNYRYDDGRTPFNGVGSTFLALPADWQVTGGTTADMVTLERSLQDQRFDHERQRIDVGYERRLHPQWSFSVDYRHETKEGNRPFGGVIGNSGGNRRSALLVAPVDFVTSIMNAAAHYSADGHQMGLGFHVSRFENQASSITWANPFGEVPGHAAGVAFPDGLGRSALEPDNRFYQARLFGTFNATPTVRLSANVSAGRMEQNERFLPFTVNTRLDVPAGLPREDLDGRIDTLLVDLRVSGRPLRQLNVTAGYRYDDRDNRTPRNVYQPVPGDSIDQQPVADGRINLPYSFTEHRFNVDARYRLASRTRLTAGYVRSRKDRDFMEVGRMDEDTYRLGLQLQPAAVATVTIDYVRSDRDGSRYDGNVPFVASHLPGAVDPDDPLDFENHPLLRKYFLADRTRDQIRARADVYPLASVSVGLQASYSRDDYDDGFFGLNDRRVQAYSADATLAPIDGLSLTGFITRESYDAQQLGRNFRGGPNKGPDVANPERNWGLDTDDLIDTVGFGAKWQDLGRVLNLGLGGILDMGADVVFSRSRSEIDVESGGALITAPLPDLFTRVIAYALHVDYQLNDATSLGVRVEHERYNSRDFTLDDVAPAGVDSAGRVLGLGVSSPSYKLNWITASIRHRF
jgi:MtrB/PioB family decaheme-associated outer membrane protein